MINNVEIWIPVSGYENLYDVSNQGRVRSRHKKTSKIILKQSNTTTGYKKVELSKEGVKKSFKVHRLVAQAFIPNEENKPYINHVDSNPHNNNVDNLEWCTQKENMEHAAMHGNHKSRAWLNKDEVIREYRSGKSIRQIAEEYSSGACKTIKNVLQREKIPLRSLSEQKDKYSINKKEMITMFEKGKRNIEIATYFNAPARLVATYKYKWKRGEKIC